MSEGITITRLEVCNFRRIRAGQWELKDGLNRLTSGGKNKQGKTSFLHAVRVLFEGAGAVPSEPINSEKDPDDESFVRGCLSNGWTIKRTFTDSGNTYLYVEGPSGLKGKQSNINPWLGDGHFSPTGFFDKSPDEQAKALLSLASDPDLEEKLDALARKESELYEERTPLISEKRRLNGVTPPEGDRPEPVSVKDEMRRLDALKAEQRAWEKLDTEKSDLTQNIKTNNEDQIESSNKIERLRRELAEEEKWLKKLKTEQRGLEERRDEVCDELDARPDIEGDIAEVREAIDRAEEIQEELEPWKEYDRSQERLEEVKAEERKMTERIEEVRSERDQVIAEAEFPIDGLSFTPAGEVLLNGHPLEQASGRERVELSVTAALAYDPTLRVVLHDEADGVDEEGLERLAELCEENDLQLIIARLGVEGPGELEVVDGWGPAPEEEE